MCSVCSAYDVDERKFGTVKMRAPFWIGYFCDHLKSARHKTNCEKKALHEEAEKRRIELGGQPTKRLKQTVLSFGTKILLIARFVTGS